MTSQGEPNNLRLAEWLGEVHEQVKLTYYESWPEIVAEQKPLIEQLMKRANTSNPLSAVIPVVKGIPRNDASRLILLAVAAEMITRRIH